MLNFTKFERVNPEKRDVLLRLKDFNEVYQVFGKQSSCPKTAVHSSFLD